MDELFPLRVRVASRPNGEQLEPWFDGKVHSAAEDDQVPGVYNTACNSSVGVGMVNGWPWGRDQGDAEWLSADAHVTCHVCPYQEGKLQRTLAAANTSRR